MKPSRYSDSYIEENFRKGYWRKEGVVELWEANARRLPEREAMIDARQRLSWREAVRKAHNLAKSLIRLGLEKDASLVLLLPNCVENFLARAACEKAGILCAHLPPTFRFHELEKILAQAQPAATVTPWIWNKLDFVSFLQERLPGFPSLKYLIVSGERNPPGTLALESLMTPQGSSGEALPAGRQYKPWEVSLITSTTGSTGLPKLVENPAAARLKCGEEFRRGFEITEDDTVLLSVAGVGGGAFMAYYSSPLTGCRVVVQERFEPEETLRIIEKDKITILPVVPTQAIRLAEHPSLCSYDLESLRAVGVYGAPLHYETGKKIEASLKAKVVQFWGSHDCGIGVVTSVRKSQRIRLGTVGKPRQGSGEEISIHGDRDEFLPPGEVGEVWARGPACVSGYYRDEKATRSVWTADGWFRCGDLGYLDRWGYLRLVGRKKDIIIRGGQNISPAELEELLADHPGVQMSAVVGVPDPVWGERVCAYIVLRDGWKLTLEDISAYLREKQVASFKIPERLEIVSSFPQVQDKVDKKALREDVTRKLKTKGE